MTYYKVIQIWKGVKSFSNTYVRLTKGDNSVKHNTVNSAVITTRILNLISLHSPLLKPNRPRFDDIIKGGFIIISDTCNENVTSFVDQRQQLYEKMKYIQAYIHNVMYENYTIKY